MIAVLSALASSPFVWLLVGRLVMAGLALSYDQHHHRP